ncbi:hypothetical protein PIIN_10812 [Serendipita indica DSM 11827]|nr:hypothetical protein PIIN_10812 [Serendipita indica DSM 11827]
MGALSPQVHRLLFARASTALGTLHEHGYLHGDISHGNFLFHIADSLDDSRVLVVDFEKASTRSKANFEAAARGEKAILLRLFLTYGATKEELLAA